MHVGQHFRMLSVPGVVKLLLAQAQMYPWHLLRLHLSFHPRHSSLQTTGGVVVGIIDVLKSEIDPCFIILRLW